MLRRQNRTSLKSRRQRLGALTASLSSRDAAFRNAVGSAQPVMLSVMSKAACYQDSNDSRVLSMYTSARIGNGLHPQPMGFDEVRSEQPLPEHSAHRFVDAEVAQRFSVSDRLLQPGERREPGSLL